MTVFDVNGAQPSSSIYGRGFLGQTDFTLRSVLRWTDTDQNYTFGMGTPSTKFNKNSLSALDKLSFSA